MVRIEEKHEAEEMLNVFKPDDEFLVNEKNFEDIKKEILGESSDDSSDGSGSSLGCIFA
jgi:pre-mRNA-splicing factor CWC22